VLCHQDRDGDADEEAALNTSSCQLSSEDRDGRLQSRSSISAYSLAIFDDGGTASGSRALASSHSDSARSVSSMNGTSARSSAADAAPRTRGLTAPLLHRPRTAATAARSETCALV